MYKLYVYKLCAKFTCKVCKFIFKVMIKLIVIETSRNQNLNIENILCNMEDQFEMFSWYSEECSKKLK
jgi:hypothetical protein